MPRAYFVAMPLLSGYLVVLGKFVLYSMYVSCYYIACISGYLPEF